MFCQNCGNQMNDTDVFCQSCGAKNFLSNSQDQASPNSQPIGFAPSNSHSGHQPIQSPVQPPVINPAQQQVGQYSQQPIQQPIQQPVSQYSQQPIQQPINQFNQPQPQPPVTGANTQYQYGNPNNAYQQQAATTPKKKNFGIIAIASVLALCVIGVVLFFVINSNSGKSTRSSQVSKGVNTDDLGNIMNGQYFFDDGTNQYYSSFDTNAAAHIYKMKKGSNTATSIFDGFGWSLVVNNNWLYFSGNAGEKIDGTYNLFRIKTDGTGLEKLNSGYCFGMNIYNNSLYYIKTLDSKSKQYDVYKCDLDGKNEATILTGEIYNFVIYNTDLYYLNSAGDIYKAKSDGTGSTKISTEPITRFVIGNGMLVVETKTSEIKVMNPNGTSIKSVRAAGTKPIASLNSSKGQIYYAEYDTDAVGGTYAFNYYLHSIKFDGTGDKLVYQGLSYGTYVNILNNKVFVLDYAINPTTNKMPAIAKNMDLDGKNVKELFR